jgi:peptide/nickel transport system substrate-binding protein
LKTLETGVRSADSRQVVRLWGGRDSARITCQFLPPNFPGYRAYCRFTVSPNAARKWTAPDLAKARRLVAASGTKGMPVVLEAFPPGPDPKIGRYLASVLRSLDYRVRLYAHMPGTLEQFWASRRKIGATLTWWIADYPAASNFIRIFRCGHRPNVSEFCDRRIDAQIKRALALQVSDPGRANELWTKIDHALVDQAPLVPLLNPQALDFVSKRLGN